MFKHSATWQGRVSEFNPSHSPLYSDLTDALVKGPSLHVFQSIQVPISVVCPSKLKTPACYMANILNQTLVQSLFADYSKPICHIWQCTAAILWQHARIVLIGVGALNQIEGFQLVNRWIWKLIVSLKGGSWNSGHCHPYPHPYPHSTPPHSSFSSSSSRTPQQTQRRSKVCWC